MEPPRTMEPIADHIQLPKLCNTKYFMYPAGLCREPRKLDQPLVMLTDRYTRSRQVNQEYLEIGGEVPSLPYCRGTGGPRALVGGGLGLGYQSNLRRDVEPRSTNPRRSLATAATSLQLPHDLDARKSIYKSDIPHLPTFPGIRVFL